MSDKEPLMDKIGFDCEKYFAMQSSRIEERIAQFGGKLYLEFGGKLFDDYHASRVLPGFKPDAKLQLLLRMKESAEIVISINAEAIASGKVREDLGITYNQDVLRLIDAFRAAGLYVGSVCLTRYKGQKAAKSFERFLAKQGVKTYHLYDIPDYPFAVDHIVSDDGLGKNDYIETTRPLVVVTAPGPGSGKMATCISQLYQDNLRGVKSGYAKFETFPIWNLPLKHPVNLAYEAATADLNDVNMIDPYHLEAYGVSTVNYNRDIENFPVLNHLFTKIFFFFSYQSPTDMGVNMAGHCISDDAICQEAARQEIIRRYLRSLVDLQRGKVEENVPTKILSIMKANGIEVDERACVAPAKERAAKTGRPACAIELNNGAIFTGKTSSLLGPAGAMLLNALKSLAGIGDGVLVLPAAILEPVCALKTDALHGHNPRLHISELLVILAISAITNPLADLVMKQLPKLRGAQAHSSVILSETDADTLRKLGVDLTCEPVYDSKKLYHSK